jgi:hypothetical protein
MLDFILTIQFNSFSATKLELTPKFFKLVLAIFMWIQLAPNYLLNLAPKLL